MFTGFGEISLFKDTEAVITTQRGKTAKLVFDRKQNSVIKSMYCILRNVLKDKGQHVSRFSMYVMTYWKLGNDSSAV